MLVDAKKLISLFEEKQSEWSGNDTLDTGIRIGLMIAQICVQSLILMGESSKYSSELEYMVAEKKRIDAIANEAGYGGESK